MFGSLIKICIAHFHKFSKPKTTHIMQSAQFCNWHLSQLWDTAGLHLSKLDLPKSCLWIYLMKVTHNSSFVHQPRGIMVDWAKTNKQAEFEFPTSKKKKVSQGWGKYVAKCQRDSLLLGSLAGRRSAFDLFLSGLAWHRPQSCPRHNRSYSSGERVRERWVDEVG